MSFTNPLQISSCPITLTEFNNNEEIIYLPCNHVFDPGAIFAWIDVNENCPICRKKVTKDELKSCMFNFHEPVLSIEKSKYVICSKCNKSKYRNNFKGFDKNFKCGGCRKKNVYKKNVYKKNVYKETDHELAVVIAYSLIHC